MDSAGSRRATRSPGHLGLICVISDSPFSYTVDAGLQYDLRCEVLPESDHCLSVTFSLDDSNHLAVRKHPYTHWAIMNDDGQWIHYKV